MNLTSELDNLKEEIKVHAMDCGLDFFDVVFELCTYEQVNQIAALGGFPTRYPHWRFGMEYERLNKSYVWGLSRIYELVINNDPCYAYLMASNPLVDQKLVMAHVYAHSDFFKNNLFFQHTSRKAIDEMANHGARLRALAERHGHENVETFLDTCLSLENLIDIHSVAIRRRDERRGKTRLLSEPVEETVEIGRIRAKQYMDRFINPEEFLARRKQELKHEQEKKKHFPEEPERDVLLFLLDYAPLEPWQHEVLSIIRDEAYYFAPQWMTKIMNEGWATYWHSRMMTEHLATDHEIVDFADHHSSTVAQPRGSLNPYKLGVELFRDVEERWDKGRHGPEWEACEDYATQQQWDRHEMAGRAKIFEVRRLYNDVTFVDTFLTPEFCREHKLFSYRFNAASGQQEISSREFAEIKQQLLATLTNGGQPFIYVVEGNYGNRGELFLRHRYEGIELRLDHARDTLRNLQRVWSRPVHLETTVGNRGRLLTCDGSDVHEKEWVTEAPPEDPEDADTE